MNPNRNYDDNSYAATAARHQQRSAADADVDTRMAFIRRTYSHLAGAIAALVGVEALLFATGVHEMLVPLMLGTQYSWLIVLGLFMAVGHIANKWAMSPKSKPMQYAGLGLYVAVQAIIFLPLIALGLQIQPTAIPAAALVTLVVFAALTAIVFISKEDFSFMRIALQVAGFLALGGIGASILFGFTLGVWFSVFMIGLAAGYILYYTGNVLHHYQTNQHVAASLALFSAVALMFWYVLSIFLRE
jgi:FtsH-binding integral membrane protein